MFKKKNIYEWRYVECEYVYVYFQRAIGHRQS